MWSYDLILSLIFILFLETLEQKSVCVNLLSAMIIFLIFVLHFAFFYLLYFTTYMDLMSLK